VEVSILTAAEAEMKMKDAVITMKIATMMKKMIVHHRATEVMKATKMIMMKTTINIIVAAIHQEADVVHNMKMMTTTTITAEAGNARDEARIGIVDKDVVKKDLEEAGEAMKVDLVVATVAEINEAVMMNIEEEIKADMATRKDMEAPRVMAKMKMMIGQKEEEGILVNHAEDLHRWILKNADV